MLGTITTLVLLLTVAIEMNGICMTSEYVRFGECTRLYGFHNVETCPSFDYTCIYDMMYYPRNIDVAVIEGADSIQVIFNHCLLTQFDQAIINENGRFLITSLTIYNSSLKDIDLRAFDFLRSLNLSCNQLERFPSGAFKALNIIVNVDLSHNIIKSLNNSLFEIPNLETLYLSYNRISNITSGIFSYSQNLQFLDLSSNLILHLGIGVFSGLRNLLSIKLSNNSILAISNWIFLNTPQLQNLDVSYNHLDQLDIMEVITATKLLKINVNDNMFHCKDLSQIISICKKHAITVIQGTETLQTSLHGIKCNIVNDKSSTNTSTDDEVSPIRDFFDTGFENSRFYKFLKNLSANDKMLRNLVDVASNISKKSVDSLDNYFSDGFEKTKIYKFFNRNLNGTNDDAKMFYREFLRMENDEYVDSNVFRKLITHDIQKVVSLLIAVLLVLLLLIAIVIGHKVFKVSLPIINRCRCRNHFTHETELTI